MNSIKKIFLSFVLSSFAFSAFSQSILTADEAVVKAIKNNKNANAAILNIEQQKQLQKSAINIPNPELTWQSPTGVFYVGGITQSFEFPTVYSKQYQLQKQKVGIAQTQKVANEIVVAYQVRSLYLNIQYADSLKSLLYIQDTIYSKLASSAQRLFNAGQIDYLQKSFTETQYGEIHNQYEQSKINYLSLINQLKFITDISNEIIFSPLKSIKNTLLQESSINQNTDFLIAKQTETLAQKNLEIERNKALPGLVLGYMNQAERNTPTNLRFQFGLSVPLWFWQYKGNINAAKTDIKINQEKTLGVQQELSMQLMQIQNELAQNAQSLNYYEQTGLKKAAEIINTSQRFLNSGETDYINYLRNINDAYAIKMKYLEAIKNANQGTISLNYLTGKQ
ncbi:MAG: TolC family protein [Oligoflexus sp.]|nr:TolC family protein [Pseudopedobacter sp.]